MSTASYFSDGQPYQFLFLRTKGKTIKNESDRIQKKIIICSPQCQKKLCMCSSKFTPWKRERGLEYHDDVQLQLKPPGKASATVRERRLFGIREKLFFFEMLILVESSGEIRKLLFVVERQVHGRVECVDLERVIQIARAQRVGI